MWFSRTPGPKRKEGPAGPNDKKIKVMVHVMFVKIIPR